MTYWHTGEVPKVYLAALCAWREARGESDEAITGVLWVMVNRAAKPSWWGKDLEEVILKPLQFSSFNPTDPNAVKFPAPHDPKFSAILGLTERVLMRQLADPTNGATHYHDVSVTPNWAASMTRSASIGAFFFYK